MPAGSAPATTTPPTPAPPHRGVLGRSDGPEILRRVDRHDLTFVGGAPAVVNTIVTAASDRKEPRPRRDVRTIVGEAPPPTATIDRLETELGWEFIQIYGLTETSSMLTLNRRRAEWDALTPFERARRLGHAGPPAIGTRLGLAPNGEVLARGNTVFSGYWRQPEATAQALAGGWFHTGDGGCIDERGYVTISDRKKGRDHLRW